MIKAWTEEADGKKILNTGPQDRKDAQADPLQLLELHRPTNGYEGHQRQARAPQR